MKTLLFVMIALASTAVMGASNVGKCVYPKVITKSDGNLGFKQPIEILSEPSSQSKKSTLEQFSAFSIGAESNGFIQLLTVPDYDAADPESAAGKIFGWAKLKDFDYQALRNCN